MEHRFEKVLVLCARHLEQKTYESGCGNFDLGLPIAGWEFGFFCRVQGPSEVPYAPLDIKQCLAYALRYDVDWIRFDEAAAVTPGLRVFAWTSASTA